MGFSRQTLAARTLPPVTIRELRLALQDEWAAMPQQLIDTLILSMGRRCETFLARARRVDCWYWNEFTCATETQDSNFSFTCGTSYEETPTSAANDSPCTYTVRADPRESAALVRRPNVPPL
ncbi:hypothetical protein TNCV_3301691 [Trichonephila clavipes]|nr:hypothetical protein TNCV_3301691 [Trichonephila clavipes]